MIGTPKREIDMNFDRNKFSSLVHYIIRECRSDPKKLGKTKLNKMLWFIDSFAYELWGDAITGEVYKRFQHGPVASHLTNTLNELKASGNITFDDDTAEFETILFYSSRKPDVSCFSEQELHIIDSKIEWIRDDHSASSISDKTHDEMWKIAELHEVLPYEAAAIKFAPASEELFEWARKEAAAG